MGISKNTLKPKHLNNINLVKDSLRARRCANRITKTKEKHEHGMKALYVACVDRAEQILYSK